MLFRDGKRMVRNGAATNDLVLSADADGIVFWKRGNTGTLWERLV